MNDAGMHVCFVCNELPPASAGGIGPCVLTTAMELVRLGHHVTVAGLYDRDYGWKHEGIDVRPVFYPRIRRSRLAPIASLVWDRIALHRHIQRIHKDNPIDVVEWPDYEGLFLNPIRGITDVMRNHGPSMSQRLYGVARKSWRLESFELSTMKRIPNWIGVSHWFMEEWLRISRSNPKRRAVIYNPVDCDLFSPSDEKRSDNLVVYAGSLIERKGVFALARAARIFLEELPSTRLVFFGRDIHGSGAERILQEAGDRVGDRIEVCPPLSQTELAGIMRQATIFAMPSRLESFGNVWAEAMASGAAIVGSKLTAGPEIVPDGIAGILADPEDPSSIAAAVCKLMNSGSLRQRLGLAGRQSALSRFSVAVSSPSLISFYRECVAAGDA